MSFQDLSFNDSQWWTKAMESYNTPPSTESSNDAPMDFSLETKEPPQEISLPSSPASARWVGSQPVCLRSLLATAEKQLDFLIVDEPPPWTPSPSPRFPRIHEPTQFHDPSRKPRPSRIKPSTRDNVRKRPGRHLVSAASRQAPYPDTTFFRTLKDVPGQGDQKTNHKTSSASSHQRSALAPANIHNVVQTIDDVTHANRSVSLPSLALSPLPTQSPPENSMDVSPPPRFQRVSNMPPPVPPSKCHFEPSPESLKMPPPSVPSSKCHFEPSPEPSFNDSPPPTLKLHRMIVEQRKRKEERLHEKETNVAAPSSYLKPTKETKLSRTISSPARSQGPPVLGMRRGHTTTYSGIGSRPLPTKQQGFKPPLLRKPQGSQQSAQVKREKPSSAPTSTVHFKTPALPSKSSSLPTPSPAKRKEPNSPDNDCEEADSSFGDVPLGMDLDELEGVMQEYD